MSIFEADLSAFADDLRLADPAECTIQTYPLEEFERSMTALPRTALRNRE